MAVGIPEVRAVLAERMPTYDRRDDLERLLATFPETDDPTAMSPSRLRTALGLASR